MKRLLGFLKAALALPGRILSAIVQVARGLKPRQLNAILGLAGLLMFGGGVACYSLPAGLIALGAGLYLDSVIGGRK